MNTTGKIIMENGKVVFKRFGAAAKNKIKLGLAAFCNIANNDTTTEEGYLWDARRGKAIRDDLNTLLDNLKSVRFDSEVTRAMLMENAEIGITHITTNANSPTSELPGGTMEWKRASGLLLKRTAQFGTFVLFGYGTGNIAVTTTDNGGGTWSKWGKLNTDNDIKGTKIWNVSEWKEAGGNLPTDAEYGSILRTLGNTDPGQEKNADSYYIFQEYIDDNTVRTWSGMNATNGSKIVKWQELVKRQDIINPVKVLTYNGSNENLGANLSNAFDFTINAPSGYLYLSHLQASVDDNRLLIYRVYIHPSTGKLRVCIRNMSNEDANNFSIAVPVLFIKSDLYE